MNSENGIQISRKIGKFCLNIQIKKVFMRRYLQTKPKPHAILAKASQEILVKYLITGPSMDSARTFVEVHKNLIFQSKNFRVICINTLRHNMNENHNSQPSIYTMKLKPWCVITCFQYNVPTYVCVCIIDQQYPTLHRERQKH